MMDLQIELESTLVLIPFQAIARVGTVSTSQYPAYQRYRSKQQDSHIVPVWHACCKLVST